MVAGEEEKWGRARKLKNMPKYLGEETSILVHRELLVDGKQMMPWSCRVVGQMDMAMRLNVF